jgi:hypothetical protein
LLALSRHPASLYLVHNLNDNGQKEKKKDVNKILHTTKYVHASQLFFTPNGLRTWAVLTSPTSNEPSGEEELKETQVEIEFENRFPTG